MNQGFQFFLRHWFATQQAATLLEQEKALVEKSLQNLFGYFLIQLGNAAPISFLSQSRVKHKVLVDNVVQVSHPSFLGVDFVQADLNFLPIAKESTDVVFMPHTLELAADPYLLLRQVDAMLVPQGHLVMSGFNPYGCAIVRFRWQEKNSPLRNANLIRLTRLIEWLEVLGYDIKWHAHAPVYCFGKRETDRAGLVMWFFKALEWCEKKLSLLGLEFGNVYCLVAQKRIDAPKLVGKRWHTPSWMPRANKGASPIRAKVSLRSYIKDLWCK